MTEHDERPPEEETGQSREAGDPDLRPLPDGGLGENMPEWLRRPPAWRELPGTGASTSISEPATVTEVVAAAAVPDVEADVTIVERVMPPIDTSVIDPKTLIDFEDLPAWLQELGSKRATAEATAEASSTDESLKSPTGIDVADPAPETIAAFTEHLPVTVVEQPVQAVETGAQSSLDLAIWQQGPFIAVLVVALLAAISVAILYATGTF